jgi:hypothetical protein
MTRRRLILAACVSVVALGGAWCLPGRLSPEERLLVGSWHTNWCDGITVVLHMKPNRTCAVRFVSSATGAVIWHGGWSEFHGRWGVQSEQLESVWEDGLIERIRRHLSANMHTSEREPVRLQYRFTWVSDDEFVIEKQGGATHVWTRDRGD